MKNDVELIEPLTYMSIDLDKQDHQEFIVRLDRILDKNNLPKPLVKRKEGLSYLLVSDSHDTYCYAKELWLRMTNIEKKTIPYF